MLCRVAILLSGTCTLLYAPDALFAQTPSLLGQTPYLCATEFAGGLGFDPVRKRWRGSALVTSEKDNKFFIGVKLLRNRSEPLPYIGGEVRFVDYLVTITAWGANNAIGCYGPEANENRTVSLKEGDMEIKCRSELTEYVFNLKTNRFLAAYFGGYTDGNDNQDNTPGMSGGTCTKRVFVESNGRFCRMKG